MKRKVVIALLSLGVVAAIAHAAPDLHQSLHVYGFGAETLPERVAQAIAVASHQAESGVQLALTMIVAPASSRRSNTATRVATSSGCRPVVGSSKT